MFAYATRSLPMIRNTSGKQYNHAATVLDNSPDTGFVLSARQ